MAQVGIRLKTVLGRKLPITFSSPGYLPPTLITHTRNSPAYILYNGVMTGPFAANEKAIRNINGVPHLLCERSKTNVKTYSEQAEQWNGGYFNLDVNAVIAPDGETAGDKFIDSTFNSWHRTYINNLSVDTPNFYINSIFLKDAGEIKYYSLNLDDPSLPGSGIGPSAFFDVRDGSIAAQNDLDRAGSIALDNGWYFCYIIKQATSYSPNAVARLLTISDSLETHYAGSVQGCYIWGWELYESAHIGSYIKSEASPETRLATNSYADTGDVPTWLRNKFRISWVPQPLINNSSQDHVLCQMRDSAKDYTLYYKGSTGQVILNDSVVGDILTKSAITLADEHIDPVLFDLTLNNGSVCSLTVSSDQSGFSGGGTQAGSAAVSYDGVFYIGAENTLADCADGLVGVIQL